MLPDKLCYFIGFSCLLWELAMMVVRNRSSERASNWSKDAQLGNGCKLGATIIILLIG